MTKLVTATQAVARIKARINDGAIVTASSASARDGNLTYEHEGATPGGLDQAIAARNHGALVIAQVKRIKQNGSLRPHDVRIPGHLVDLIVIDPDQQQTNETQYDPAISGKIIRPWDSFALPGDGVEKIIARRLDRQPRLRTPGLTAGCGGCGGFVDITSHATWMGDFPELTCGGLKQSGQSRELGHYGLDALLGGKDGDHADRSQPDTMGQSGLNAK